MIKQLLSLALAAGLTIGCFSFNQATHPGEAPGPDPSTAEHEVTSTGNTNGHTDPAPFNFRLHIVGDVMLADYKDRTYTGNFNDLTNKMPPTYFLEKVRSIFEDDDYTIVNLENVFTDKPLTEAPKAGSPVYWYKSRTSNTQILTSSSVEAVSLANNHTGDYGETGRLDTIAAVDAAGLQYGTEDKTFYLQKNGYMIAVICHGLWYSGQEDAIIKRVQEAEQNSDFQIVFYHGGTERVHAPEQWRINASRKLVDYGADLVVGNHPHVLQPVESYKGVDIIYSIGNFCFGGDTHPENRTMIYELNLTINPDLTLASKSSQIIPCYCYTGSTNNFQPTVITDAATKQRVLDFMAWKIGSPV